MKAILEDAAAVGNATARALGFQTRDRETQRPTSTRTAPGRLRSSVPTTSGSSTGGIGGRNLDARSMFFYLATVNTPAMAMKMVGLGSQYAYANHDSSGDVLDGSKQYRLRIPADVPAKDFWWIVVYDPQTPSELQTSQPLPEQERPL